MTYDEFVGQVQHRARLADTGEAVGAIRATLQTLAERLAGGEADHLASQLPREVGMYLLMGNPIESQRFSLDEFFMRVAEREGPGVEVPEAAVHARVVADVVGEAVSLGQFTDVLAQLPPEFAPLFAANSTGNLKQNR